MLSGTKTVYAFVILLFCYHVFSKKLYAKKTFWLPALTVSFLLIIFKDIVLAKTKFLWGLFYDLYQGQGFLYSFTSFRNEIFADVSKLYFEKWQIYNYVIGGRLGIRSFEMALFDLFSFFGCLGTLIYLYYLRRYFLKQFLKTTGPLGIFIVSTLALAAFFTGQFFVNSTVILTVWFFLIVFKLNFDEKQRVKADAP